MGFKELFNMQQAPQNNAGAVGQLNDQMVIDRFKNKMNLAIVRAENNPENHGVLSIETDNPKQVLINSVNNNFRRFTGGEQPAPWIKEKPSKFVDFMQRRWAPIGAENDPDNLNKNWAPNVKSIIRQNSTGDEIKEFERLNLL